MIKLTEYQEFTKYFLLNGSFVRKKCVQSMERIKKCGAIKIFIPIRRKVAVST